MEKIDLTDVTFLIPIRINSSEKLMNLKLILNYLLDRFETNITVLEADIEESNLTQTKVEKIFVFDGNPVFHKTKYINFMIKSVKTPFIAIWDENVLMESNQIHDSVDLLRNGKVDMVIPYNGRLYNTHSMFTNLFIREKKLDVFSYNIDKFQTKFGHFSVDGAILINKDSYINAGMENENLYGWNLENLERLKRFEILGFNIKRIEGPAFKLYQPRETNSWQRDNLLKKNSLNEYLNLCKRNKHDIIKHCHKLENNDSDLSVKNVIKESLQVIQSLWIGTKLSEMERLCISSFLENGHEFHLYIYDDVKNIPDGTTLKDANNIISSDKIFKYRGFDSYSGFSNIFRYKLLLERGGYWSDMDVICLKPFFHNTEYIFAAERPYYPIYKNEINAASCLFKVPANSEIMNYCYQESIKKKPDELQWGQIGPQLLTNAITKFNLWRYVANSEVFCPVDVRDWYKSFNCDLNMDTLTGAHAVHLWNEMWRRNKVDKSKRFKKNSIYEELKKKYLN